MWSSSESLGTTTFDSLMVRAFDEPDAMYGLVARAVRWSADGLTASLDFDAPLVASQSDEAKYQVVLVSDGTRIVDGEGNQLGTDGAVLADAQLRTSAPDVLAVGDCASFPSARYGERLLVHHWDNALQGPRTVAANVMQRPKRVTR